MLSICYFDQCLSQVFPFALLSCLSVVTWMFLSWPVRFVVHDLDSSYYGVWLDLETIMCWLTSRLNTCDLDIGARHDLEPEVHDLDPAACDLAEGARRGASGAHRPEPAGEEQGVWVAQRASGGGAERSDGEGTEARDAWGWMGDERRYRGTRQTQLGRRSGDGASSRVSICVVS